jgi:hypothetical protein
MPEYPQRGVAVVQRQISDGTFTVPGGARRPYCPLRVGLHLTDRIVLALERAGPCADAGGLIREDSDVSIGAR